MKCPKCGREIHEEANFCPYCMEKFRGTKLSSDKPVRNIWPMIMMALELVVIIVLVVVVVRKQPIKPTESLLQNENNTTINQDNSHTTETVDKIENTGEVKENVCYYNVPTASVILEYYYDEIEQTLFFLTSKNVSYKIDIQEKSIIESSATNPVLTECSFKNGILKVTICCDEIPISNTYVFDLNVEKLFYSSDFFNKDVMSNYIVYPEGKIEFVTSSEDYYYFDYYNSEIVFSNQTQAVLVDSFFVDEVLVIKIKDNEFLDTYMYMFDISKNVVAENTSLSGRDRLIGKDNISKFAINKNTNRFEFDSINGPSYTIAIDTGEILECSSTYVMQNGKPAEVIAYKYINNIIEITVISGEFLQEMTYVFDVSLY